MSKPLLLTHKQRQFILHYIRGMSGTDAAINSYGVSNRNSAAVIASENLRKPNILVAINALAPNGYILENSVKALSEALDATKGVNKLPDHNTRLKAATISIKLLREIYE